MSNEDLFSATLASAVLITSGDEIHAAVVDELDTRSAVAGGLEASLAAAMTGKRHPGDFGMAIAGALLAPVLIEMGKSIWKTYLKVGQMA